MEILRNIVQSLVVMTLVLATASIGFCQANEERARLSSPVNEETVVRFFFAPANSYFHPPLIFRVVADGDLRLNTAPKVNLGGRTPYISLAEMQHLVDRLTNAGLLWRVRKQAALPKRIEPQDVTDRMRIEVFLTDRTDSTLLDPKKICTTLAGFDSAFKTPRALWEFQLFRRDYGCEVPGFNRQKYIDHDTGSL